MTDSRKRSLSLSLEFIKQPRTFRIFSPDELRSNKLDQVFNYTTRDMQWDPETAHKGGRVTEMLSEHTLQGFLQGYTLTGRCGLFPSYEAFLGIVTTMIERESFLLLAFFLLFDADASVLSPSTQNTPSVSSIGYVF